MVTTRALAAALTIETPQRRVSSPPRYKMTPLPARP